MPEMNEIRRAALLQTGFFFAILISGIVVMAYYEFKEERSKKVQRRKLSFWNDIFPIVLCGALLVPIVVIILWSSMSAGGPWP